jgi:hypothetical protein
LGQVPDAEEAHVAVDVEVDVELLKSEIKKTYASVSTEPEKDFIFPTGRGWAEDLEARRWGSAWGLISRGAPARDRGDVLARS